MDKKILIGAYIELKALYKESHIKAPICINALCSVFTPQDTPICAHCGQIIEKTDMSKAERITINELLGQYAFDEYDEENSVFIEVVSGSNIYLFSNYTAYRIDHNLNKPIVLSQKEITFNIAQFEKKYKVQIEMIKKITGKKVCVKYGSVETDQYASPLKIGKHRGLFVNKC